MRWLLRRENLYLGCFLFHFLLILLVCCRDTFSVLAQGYTIFPPRLDSWWQNAESVAAAGLGQGLPRSSFARQGLAAYMHGAGIEAGYGFFAPNVPDSCKLVYELHYPEGNVEYDQPSVSDAATGVRFASLLDYIGQTPDPLREVLLKMLAFSVWQEHPRAVMVRAVFGFINLPSPAEFKRGEKESYNFSSSYDFRFAEQVQREAPP